MAAQYTRVVTHIRRGNPGAEPGKWPRLPGSIGGHPSVCVWTRPRGTRHDVMQRRHDVRGSGRVELCVYESPLRVAKRLGWGGVCLSSNFIKHLSGQIMMAGVFVARRRGLQIEAHSMLEEKFLPIKPEYAQNSRYNF